MIVGLLALSLFAFPRAEGATKSVTEFTQELQTSLNQGPEVYLAKRAEVLNEMLDKGEGQAWKIIRNLDEQVLLQHLQKVSDKLWLLPEGHPGRALKISFE